jgi:hypothetical protein
MPGLWIDRLVPVTVRIHQAICRGPQTAAVLQAYEGGGQEGFRECRRAQERSGVELPDLPGPRLWFAWGPVMGEGGRCLRLGGGGRAAQCVGAQPW